MAEVNIQRRFRDGLNALVPVWLRERPGFNVGYRVIWAVAALLDALLDILLAGYRAAMPGMGLDTPGLAVTSALPLVGSSRGILRGENESDEAYSARLRAWLDTHREMGSQEVIGRVIHGYLATRPRVRVIQRGSPTRGLPTWVTVESDGTVTKTEAPFDWDSVSHPERNDPDNPYWSDLWVIVDSPYPHRSNVYGDPIQWGEDQWGIGHMVSRRAFDALLSELARWKGAHTRIRCVIWSSDPDLFDPTDPASCPDGTWGGWGSYDGSGNYVRSGRDYVRCRFWEPR